MRRVFSADPDPTEWPVPVRNFDAGALHFAHGYVDILTQHRSDTGTTPYRPDSSEPHRIHPLTKPASADTRGQVTGSDAPPGGRRLAALTFTGVRVFDAKKREQWFDGTARWRPAGDDEAEGIAPDGKPPLFRG